MKKTNVRRFDQLREKAQEKRGFAMVMVMVVMLVITALCLALLLLSSTMLNNALRSNRKEQCRINAISVSKVIQQEICGTSGSNGYEYTDFPGPNGNREHNLKDKLSTVTSNQWYFFNKNADTIDIIYGYDKNNYFSYDLSDSSGLPGKTVMNLYWLDNSGQSLRALTTEDPDQAAEQFSDVYLYVQVTSTVGQETASITSIYTPIVNKEKDVVTGKTKWKDWHWEFFGHDWERGDS